VLKRKAIVIGASSGIGRELSKLLAAEGYSVGIMARRLPLLHELAAEIGADVLVQEVDVSQIQRAMEALDVMIEQMGGVDLVVISEGTGENNDPLDWSVELETMAG